LLDVDGVRTQLLANARIERHPPRSIRGLTNQNCEQSRRCDRCSQQDLPPAADLFQHPHITLHAEPTILVRLLISSQALVDRAAVVPVTGEVDIKIGPKVTVEK
jgi:hypothetical protein